MELKAYPVIDPVATGNNIRRLRMERGLTVRELQSYFGFEEPRAIYTWQKGESLPTVDNLYALGVLFEVSMQLLKVCSVIVHLHLNRYLLSPIFALPQGLPPYSQMGCAPA